MPRRKQVSDEDALRAALPVIFGKGPGEFTLAEAAAATGLSPATLLQRFGSKEAMTLAALALTNQGHADALAALPRGRGAALVIAIFVSRTPGPEHEAQMADQLLWLRESFRQPQVNAASRAYFALFRAALAERMPPMGVAPMRAVELVEAQWHGAMIQWALTGDGSLRDYVSRALADWFALCAPPAA